MSAARSIFGQEDVAWADNEVLAFARLEIKRSAQRYDQLPDGRVMPGEGAARGRLLKGDRGRRHFAAQQVAVLAGFKVDEAFLEMRVPVISRPNSYTSDHVPAPATVVITIIRRDRNNRATFGARQDGLVIAQLGVYSL